MVVNIVFALRRSVRSIVVTSYEVSYTTKVYHKNKLSESDH